MDVIEIEAVSFLKKQKNHEAHHLWGRSPAEEHLCMCPGLSINDAGWGGRESYEDGGHTDNTSGVSATENKAGRLLQLFEWSFDQQTGLLRSIRTFMLLLLGEGGVRVPATLIGCSPSPGWATKVGHAISQSDSVDRWGSMSGSVVWCHVFHNGTYWTWPVWSRSSAVSSPVHRTFNAEMVLLLVLVQLCLLPGSRVWRQFRLPTTVTVWCRNKRGEYAVELR